MSTLILHDKKGNNWSSLGIGPLAEAINPLVTREKNSCYELTFTYPVEGALFKELDIGRWIVADAGPTIQAQQQRFEIASISKPIKGIVTVYCEHYRYQMYRSIVTLGSKYTNVPAQTALNQLQARMQPKGDFTFFSDVTTMSSIDFTDPATFSNAQEALGGVRGSILDHFGGEYVFDNNHVRLLSSAGQKTNIVIAYGKNLTDITQEESIENTYTSVYGWAKVREGEDEKILTLPELYLDSEYVNNYTQRRIQMVDFSDKEPTTVEQLRTLISNFIKSNKVGIPKVSIKTSFVDLASSVLEDELKTLERVDLYDYVTVSFNKLGINSEAQVVKTVWNIALDRYESVELGEAYSSFTKVITDSQPDMSEIQGKVDWLEKAQKEASDIIKNPGKGHVVIYPSLADPQELLIMDTTNVNTAQKVWRWNVGGLGFSSTGYNGTYGLAMTNNGAIVADRITAGVLRAIAIQGVAISGSTFETTGNGSKILINGGTVESFGSSGALFSKLDGLSFKLYKNDGRTLLGQIMRVQDVATQKQTMSFASERDTYISISSKNTSGVYIRQFVLDGSTGEITMSNITMNGTIKDGRLQNFSAAVKFLVPNNVALDFYSHLNMHGYSILNQSDIRLKENIEETKVDGIKETKKIRMVDYDWRQNYQSRTQELQPPKERQFGMIAQHAPFLSTKSDGDNYLKIDVNKQIHLNTLTNQQLIAIVEQQNQRLERIEKLLKLDEEGENG